MNAPVEAQSISALGSLLANPPQYPRNPTHEVRESLVLYIVRVPGSKDVFLTPLKPPTKQSISLEAIQSSVYYFHVVTREDEEVKRSIDVQRHSEDAERANPAIHRKPLPPTPHSNYPPHEKPIPPPKSYPSYQPGFIGDPDAKQNERFAARGSHIRFASEVETHDQENRRLSRSPKRFQPGLDLNSHYQSSSRAYDGLADDTSSHPALSQHLQHHGRQDSPGSYQYSSRSDTSNLYTSPESNTYHQSQFGCQASPSHRQPFDHVEITVIRRDPATGSQWNVGNIAIGENDASNMPLNPVAVEINTPGYNRFASIPESSRPGTGYSNAESIKEALANGRLAAPEQHGNEANNHTFTRVAEYQEHFINTRSLKLHRRTDSSHSVTKSSSPTKQSRQVFSFLSPWQGLCTFTNSIDGRSLKCRHTLTSSKFTEEDTTATVAELRFNLPWFDRSHGGDRLPDDDALPISRLLGPRSGKDTVKRGFRKFREHVRERSASSDDQPAVLREVSPQSKVESEMDRLSLKLGREKAGGGFKGTSAKLGKLIIEDEGLKMCDLVVAACMGVWWQHYDERDE